MGSITFKKQRVQTNGTLPAIGSQTPSFSLVSQDLQEKTLDDFQGKFKILNIVPSLDTSVCASTAKKFHDALRNRDDVALLNISLDLPFAQARFCQNNELSSQETLSAFRSSFPKDYGVLMLDGPLKGLCSRAVIVIDPNNRVIYHEHVEEVTHEPDYEKVMRALD